MINQLIIISSYIIVVYSMCNVFIILYIITQCVNGFALLLFRINRTNQIRNLIRFEHLPVGRMNRISSHNTYIYVTPAIQIRPMSEKRPTSRNIILT